MVDILLLCCCDILDPVSQLLTLRTGGSFFVGCFDACFLGTGGDFWRVFPICLIFCAEN